MEGSRRRRQRCWCCPSQVVSSSRAQHACRNRLVRLGKCWRRGKPRIAIWWTLIVPSDDVVRLGDVRDLTSLTTKTTTRFVSDTRLLSPSECLSLPDALLFFNVLRILINLHKIPQCLDTASRSVSAMDSQRAPSGSMARRSSLVRCQWSISLRPTSNALLIIGSAPCTRHSSVSRYHLDMLAHGPSSATVLGRSNYFNCRRSGPLLGFRCATATAQHVTLQTSKRRSRTPKDSPVMLFFGYLDSLLIFRTPCKLFVLSSAQVPEQPRCQSTLFARCHRSLLRHA